MKIKLRLRLARKRTIISIIPQQTLSPPAPLDLYKSSPQSLRIILKISRLLLWACLQTLACLCSILALLAISFGVDRCLAYAPLNTRRKSPPFCPCYNCLACVKSRFACSGFLAALCAYLGCVCSISLYACRIGMAKILFDSFIAFH